MQDLKEQDTKAEVDLLFHITESRTNRPIAQPTDRPRSSKIRFLCACSSITQDNARQRLSRADEWLRIHHSTYPNRRLMSIAMGRGCESQARFSDPCLLPTTAITLFLRPRAQICRHNTQSTRHSRGLWLSFYCRDQGRGQMARTRRRCEEVLASGEDRGVFSKHPFSH